MARTGAAAEKGDAQKAHPGGTVESKPSFDALWQTQKFIRSLGDLIRAEPRLRARVHRILSHYLLDLTPLQRSPLHNARRRIFHTRLDRDRRFIDEPLSPGRPREVALLYASHHDDANSFGAGYSGDTEGQLKDGLRIDRVGHPVAGGNEVEKPAVAPGREGWKGTYGEYLSEKKLARLGVPLEDIERVLVAPRSLDLRDYGIAGDVADRIESSDLAARPAVDIIVPVPSASTVGAIRVTEETLSSLLSLPLQRFLQVMTDEQRLLAEKEGTRLYIVKGAAGTGKTIVGIRRLEWLLKRRPPNDPRPILFTCYNQVLADAARQMIVSTLGRSLQESSIEVATVYQLFGQERARVGLPSFGDAVGRDRLLPLLSRARAKARSDVSMPSAAERLSDEEILDEITEIIFGRALTKVDEYIQQDRSGRGKPLDSTARQALWQVFVHLRAECRAVRVGPWEQIPAQLAIALQRSPTTQARYFGIVVDEAQDLPPSTFKVLLAMQAGSDENMLILGDAAQNVYRSSFRWSHTGLRVVGGQVHTLRRSFRSTPSIIGAALPLVAMQVARFGEDLVVPQGDGPVGPPVHLSVHESLDAELQEIATLVAVAVENGTPPSSIGVLVDSRSAREKFTRYLREFEVPHEDHGGAPRKGVNLQESSVKLLSIGSAKGLEFPMLFVPMVTNERFPANDADGEAADRARRNLYTAMTRSAWSLHLSSSASTRSLLLDELDMRFVTRCAFSKFCHRFSLNSVTLRAVI